MVGQHIQLSGACVGKEVLSSCPHVLVSISSSVGMCWQPEAINQLSRNESTRTDTTRLLSCGELESGDAGVWSGR